MTYCSKYPTAGRLLGQSIWTRTYCASNRISPTIPRTQSRSIRTSLTSFYTTPRSSQKIVKRGVTSVGIALAISIFFFLPFCLRENSPKPASQGDLEIIPLSSMDKSAPPGRPGNLTDDQEKKLRELWTAALNVFGVSAENASDEESGLSTPVPPQSDISEDGTKSDNPASEKKKKKRIGLFSRKSRSNHADSEANPSKIGGSESNPRYAQEGDDKYGQAKSYNQALASQSPEALRTAFWSMVKHDNPDALLLRFLRARKWDVDKALVMLISTMHWRGQEMHVDDDIVYHGEGAAAIASVSDKSNAAAKQEASDFLAQLRLGKSFIRGVDKEGRPMCFIRVRLHRQGDQSEASLERFTVYVIETARLFLSPPVDTAAVIFDMTGFSMANMDYAPLKFMIKCFEANYPESLGVVLIHKAPWVFQGIWNIIKGWLDPVVAGKIHFTRNAEELENFIPRDRILKELGGDDDWSYQYIEPKDDENISMSDKAAREKLLDERAGIVEKFEKATLQWSSRNSEDKEPVSLVQQRISLADQLRLNYWKLDPYTRARTLYDRLGMIQPGGHIEAFPGGVSNKST
ncbi:CRAL/TRIO domain-containing protein [Xylona heveae TC161]|uniref:CRAL/TRIO domain-containing protein n=1 Tax=Xylona heveae (strain CBS 132557 / TC161) TaxID=1328760 RepID=A0A164ZBD3_XYLHT|nr:CRAL/TRIO domain-containing protein [Xylona heveae TC161]KZF18894.1 CRAL/TRIO domain-containing protein [Xylona heveae TC161]